MHDKDLVFQRFPENAATGGVLKADKANPAIRLYGRRFYKDQTPFLLKMTNKSLVIILRTELP